MLKEYLLEALALLAEALLGNPQPASAGGCSYCSNQPVTTCGTCGADKRRYVYFTCSDSNCTVGCQATGTCCNWC